MAFEITEAGEELDSELELLYEVEDDVDVLLQMPGVRSMAVHLRALTGVVTVERGD